MPTSQGQDILSSPWVAGIAGALVGLRWAPGDAWWERLTNAGGGLVCAGFLTPAAADYFKLVSESMVSAMAFCIGLFCMSIVAATLQGLKEVKVGEIITGWVSRNKPRE